MKKYIISVSIVNLNIDIDLELEAPNDAKAISKVRQLLKKQYKKDKPKLWFTDIKVIK